MEIFAEKFSIFVLLLSRLLAMMSISPFYGGQTFSFFAKMSIAFLISLIVTPVIQFDAEFYKMVNDKFFHLIFEQLFIGFLIGIAMQFLFAAFQMAGEFFSVQMGFGISEVFDPMSQISLPLMGIIQNLIALFVFFVSGAHLYLIKAVVYSFEKIPYFHLDFFLNGSVHKNITDFLLFMASGMFLIALKMALPVMGTLILVSLTLGMLYKAAPQMNILMLGFPLKIMIAFFVLAWLSPMIVHYIFSNFDLFFKEVDTLINSGLIKAN